MDEPKTTLADGSPVTDDHRDIDPKTGLQKGYIVLAEEERAKGFVRPVRREYKHVGVRPKYPLRDLTAEEKERYDRFKYVKYEAYPTEDGVPGLGRFWTEQQLKSGCGGVTTMSQAIAETYARDPKFYGATFCCICQAHFRVGADGEFVWLDDNSRVGT